MGVVRAILALVVVAAIVGMVTLNRGEPDHPRRSASEATASALRLSA